MRRTLLLALLALSFGTLPTSAVAREVPALTPVIGVNPTILDFGYMCLGECRDREILIFNDVEDYKSLLTVTELTAIGAPILVDPPATPFTIPGDGTTVAVTLRFCVETDGPNLGTLVVVASNAENSPLAVPLIAAGSLPPACNIPPSCNTGGPYFGTIGQPITFNGTGSVDPDGMIVSYAWTFGDGNTGTGARPTHNYASGGTYTVGLCVVDDDSAQTCCERRARVINAEGEFQASQTTAQIAPCGSCPPSSQLEGEPPCRDGYVDDFNGGCNSTPPVFSMAYCNTVCGETGTYIFNGEPRSDTDWYRIVVGPGVFSYRGLPAGFVLRLSVLANQCPPVILSTTTSPSCQLSTPLGFNGPGSFVVFASPDDLIGVPYPSAYVLTITGPGIPGCEVTPAESTSWGNIKARYRH